MNQNRKQIFETPTNNIIIEDEPPHSAIHSLRELNLIDDFLFDVTTVDLESCKIIIELSLGIKIKEIQWKENQRVIHNLPGKRGVRLDFLVIDIDGNIFDVEMQKRNRGHIPKRTRFYQGLLDAPLLESGEEGFDKLNQSYIIVICGFDLFGHKKYRYTFKNMCQEIPELPLGDSCTKIILNTKGNNDTEVEPELIQFLHYVENSKPEVVSEDCDERLKYLKNRVESIKANSQIGVTFMKMETRDRLLKEDGENRIAELIRLLMKDERLDDLKKMSENPDYRKQLLQEYNL